MTKNNKGQMTVEAVLIVTLFVTLAIMAKQMLNEKKILSAMIDKPWSYIAGMVESGVWMPSDQAKLEHPNYLKRHGSPEGEKL